MAIKTYFSVYKSDFFSFVINGVRHGCSFIGGSGKGSYFSTDNTDIQKSIEGLNAFKEGTVKLVGSESDTTAKKIEEKAPEVSPVVNDEDKDKTENDEDKDKTENKLCMVHTWQEARNILYKEHGIPLSSLRNSEQIKSEAAKLGLVFQLTK